MKDKVMDALQRFSKAMFIPVLILPARCQVLDNFFHK